MFDICLSGTFGVDGQAKIFSSVGGGTPSLAGRSSCSLINSLRRQASWGWVESVGQLTLLGFILFLLAMLLVMWEVAADSYVRLVAVTTVVSTLGWPADPSENTFTFANAAVLGNAPSDTVSGTVCAVEGTATPTWVKSHVAMQPLVLYMHYLIAYHFSTLFCGYGVYPTPCP